MGIALWEVTHVHVGSAESKDSDEKQEAALSRIEARLERIEKHVAERAGRT